MSWKKWNQESKEGEFPLGEFHSSGKRREHLLKRRFPALRFFSEPVKWKKWKSPVSGSVPSVPSSPLVKGKPQEGEIQCLHGTSSKEALFPQEGGTWQGMPLNSTCPRCEIVSCRQCDTLHSERDFIAHSVLEHYDQAGSQRAGQLHRGHQRRKWN